MRMRITTGAWTAVVAALLFLQSSVALADPLGLDDCLRLAVDGNSRMRLAQQAVEIQKRERDSVRGRFLPSVKVEGNLLGWNDAQSFSIPIPSIPGVTGTNGNGIKIHDQLTYGASVTVAQPLVQLYRIYAAYKAGDEAAAGARMDEYTTRRKLEMDVVSVYLGLLSARLMSETAKAALKQIEAYEKQVREFLQNGVVERNALLKVQVQKAQIEKGLLDAGSMADFMQARLNLLTGRPIDTPIEVDERSFFSEADMTRRAHADVKLLRREALDLRPELKQIEHQRRAADMARHAAISSMLPDLNAVFKYDHLGGFGEMQAENAFYGGLMLSWTVWEWGGSWYQLKAAELRGQRVGELRVSAEEGILLDLESKRLDLLKAESARDLSLAQIAQAEENLRVEQNRYDAQETTTTDLLQAQTLLLQARDQEILDRMSLRAAVFALQVAVGRDLLSSASTEQEIPR